MAIITLTISIKKFLPERVGDSAMVDSDIGSSWLEGFFTIKETVFLPPLGGRGGGLLGRVNLSRCDGSGEATVDDLFLPRGGAVISDVGSAALLLLCSLDV